MLVHAALLALGDACGEPRSPQQDSAALLGCPAAFDGSDPLRENLQPPWRALQQREDVYLYTSDDAVRWTLAEPAPLLHSVTSLGLWIEGDHLYLFGNTLIRSPIHPTVLALTTTDLRSWRGCAWPVTESPHQGLVDAQAVRGPGGGTELMYYAFPRAKGLFDPAILPGPHEIWRAEPEERWLRALGPTFSLEYLTDPAVAWFQDRYVLAGTQRGTRIVFASSRDAVDWRLQPEEILGATVPHLQIVDDTLWMLTQRADGRSRLPQPYLHTSTDGEHWEPQRFLLDQAASEGGCASPVGGRFGDRYVLFCVRGAQLDPDGPPGASFLGAGPPVNAHLHGAAPAPTGAAQE